MIKYLLKCNNKHEFESWFSSSKEFERLKKKTLIECIFCHSKNVEKSIMSPNIISKEKKIEKKFNNREFYKIKKNLLKIRNYVEKNFEFVGDKFSEEVREILASLGFKTLNEVIGRSDLLYQVSRGGSDLDDLDLNPILTSIDTDIGD